MTSTAHYVITGTNPEGDLQTLDGVGLESVHEIAEQFLERLQDDWSQLFVYERKLHEGADAPELVEVTADIANHAFSIWLDQFGWDIEEPPVPEWFYTQLERLTINAEHELRAYRMGERRAA